jgi:hypothetical protein
METTKKESAKALAIMLKPGPGKIVVFALLLIFVVFLPLYPVHVDRYIGIAGSEPTVLEDSGRSMMSLYAVLDGGFNWTQEETSYRIVIWTTVEDNHLYFYDAKPLFLPVFGALGFLAYAASCYYIESTKSEKRLRQ